jgi:hypothetical protein
MLLLLLLLLLLHTGCTSQPPAVRHATCILCSVPSSQPAHLINYRCCTAPHCPTPTLRSALFPHAANADQHPAMDTVDEPLPRTTSKTLRMDIARMVSIEKEAHPATETHALSPTEHDAIMGLMDQQHKKLMYSNSLRK